MVNTIVAVTHLNLKLTHIAHPTEANIESLSCKFAGSLLSFINEVLIPASERYFHKKPVAFLHKGGYACRAQEGGSSLKSEHAFAQAIDFAGIRFADGSDVIVERDYRSAGPEGQFLREIAGVACKFFGTSLGPDYNELHKDHLHWSIGFPKLCS